MVVGHLPAGLEALHLRTLRRRTLTLTISCLEIHLCLAPNLEVRDEVALHLEGG